MVRVVNNTAFQILSFDRSITKPYLIQAMLVIVDVTLEDSFHYSEIDRYSCVFVMC